MKENKEKFNISRKLLYLGIVILIPIVGLIIWCISGFVGNNLDSLIKDKFSITELNYKKSSDINDFVLSVKLTEYTKAKEDSTGTVRYSIVITKNSNTTPSDMTMKVLVADYWTHYASNATSISSFTPTASGSTKTGSVSSIAYTNQNGWGLTKRVSQKPEIYIYFNYKFEDENNKVSNKSYIVKYKFDDIFKGTINE